MASVGDDGTLIKIAVFGITMSLIATAGIALLINPNGDYSYDEITSYRNELANFSGKSMISNTPWVLTAVYTPWTAGMPYENHIDDDGWLYGESINYDQIGKVAAIKLNPGQQSNTTLSSYEQDYSYASGKQWYAGGNPWGVILLNDGITDFLGIDSNTYSSGTANVWQYSGYRYVFDPTLPFSYTDGDPDNDDQATSADGKLSIVWYSFNGDEGLSGGLQIYNKGIKTAEFAAKDIIDSYESRGGTATNYKFDFNGVILDLSILFDQNALDRGMSLSTAWITGNWTMAISSASAGNFFDVKQSNAFVSTTGNLIETFINIYTLQMPSIQNPWMDVILWLLVGLPMTIAMLCVTMRIMRSVLFFV